MVDFGGRAYINTRVQNLPDDEAARKKIDFNSFHKSRVCYEILKNNTLPQKL